VSSAVKESSDTSDDVSDVALEPESSVASLPNGIPASSVDGAKDVSSLVVIGVSGVCIQNDGSAGDFVNYNA